MCVCECLLLLAFFLVTHASATTSTNPASEKISEATKSRIQATFLKAPLHFEANQDQADEQVKFVARGGGYSLFLTVNEAVMVLREASGTRQQAIVRNPMAMSERLNPKSEIQNPKSSVVRMKLVGANPDAEVIGLEQLPGKINYFIGNDPKKWRTNVSTYAKIEYRDVYPGTNLVYYGNQGKLEYDFVVAPGADPKAIKIAFEGAEKAELDSKGDLILRTALGDLRLYKPLVYQEIDGVRKEISAAYVLNPDSEPVTLKSEFKIPKSQAVGFQVAAYNLDKPLIIDPVLVYSTYLVLLCY